MCSSNFCPYKNKCCRSIAKPDKFQSYSNFEYICNENSGFEMYIKCEVKSNACVNG